MPRAQDAQERRVSDRVNSRKCTENRYKAQGR